MKNKKRKFAVFDIDGTIFRSSLLIELVEEMIRKGIFPEKARSIYERPYQKWLDRKDGYDKYIMAVVAAFLRHIKGVSEKDFVSIAGRIAREHQNRVYRHTRDLVQSLKRKNYFLLAISHSPKYIVDRVAKRWGFDKCYGTLLELDPTTKRFTGRRLHEDVIFDKAKVLRRAVEKENLTLNNSVGVGDTESDIPMLSLVERAICFNPNKTLYEMARKKKWKVVVERKNVVYEL